MECTENIVIDGEGEEKIEYTECRIVDYTKTISRLLYRFNWDSTGVENGEYTFSARAISIDNRSYQSYQSKTVNGGVTNLVCNGVCNYIDPIQIDPISTIDEGGSISVDVGYRVSDGATVTIDWGDGVSAAVIPSVNDQRLSFQDTHFYGQNGSYTIIFTITTSSGDIETESKVVIVRNVSPTISDAALSMSLVQASLDEVSLDITFVDPGVDDIHTISIDWGDGVVQTIPSTVDASSSTAISGNHVFETAGIYLVSAIVIDSQEAASSEVSFTVTVYRENDDFATSVRIEEVAEIQGSMTTAYYNIRGYFDDSNDSGRLQLVDDAGGIDFESDSVKTTTINPDNTTMTILGGGIFVSGPEEWIGNHYAFEAILIDGAPDVVRMDIYNVSITEDPFGNDEFKLVAIDGETVDGEVSVVRATATGESGNSDKVQDNTIVGGEQDDTAVNDPLFLTAKVDIVGGVDVESTEVDSTEEEEVGPDSSQPSLRPSTLPSSMPSSSSMPSDHRAKPNLDIELGGVIKLSDTETVGEDKPWKAEKGD